MVHTFELSKAISRDTFNEIIRSLKLRYYRYYWFTTAYSDKGFAAIRLYKFKRKEIKTEVQEDNDFTHYYMISLSINTANMFSGYQDPHIPQSILSFTPDHVYKIIQSGALMNVGKMWKIARLKMMKHGLTGRKG